MPTGGKPLEETLVEFVEEVNGIYFRSVLLKDVGTVVPQHAHDHDHATYVGSGAARLWVNGHWQADYHAGAAIAIKAGCEHVFQALKANTRLACVHDAASAETIKRKES